MLRYILFFYFNISEIKMCLIVEYVLGLGLFSTSLPNSKEMIIQSNAHLKMEGCLDHSDAGIWLEIETHSRKISLVVFKHKPV